jgi:cytochrome c-type biogenesis protein
VVFVLAYVGYNLLSANSPDTSYTPTITTDNSKINSLEDNSKTVIASANKSVETKADKPVVDTPEADKVSPAPNKDTSDVSDDVAASSEESEASNIMPDIPLTLINGEETTFWQLAEKGKPVVINSFASWCPPCKKEMPDFIEASEKYKGEVTFIFFDSFDGERETKEALDAFAKKYFNDDTICVIDPGYISALFQSNSLPTTILLDREGVPVNGFQGMVSKDVLINAIDQLLE